jgi:hypothetical protein
VYTVNCQISFDPPHSTLTFMWVLRQIPQAPTISVATWVVSCCDHRRIATVFSYAYASRSDREQKMSNNSDRCAMVQTVFRPPLNCFRKASQSSLVRRLSRTMAPPSYATGPGCELRRLHRADRTTGRRLRRRRRSSDADAG